MRPVPSVESSTAAPVSDPVSLSKRDKILALAGTLAALLMAGLDQTIVATAGPEIQRDLQIPAALYPWLTTAYLVASTVMLPIYGKLSDTFGRKPVLLTGVSIFLIGSLLCGLAPSTEILIAARAIQGLGSACLFTTTLAVIADLFPPQERGKYMGLIGGVMGISSVIGPIAGGVITDLLGWHWVFFINIPVGLAAMWLIVTRMPRLGGTAEGPVQVDIAGAVWLFACVIPLLLALSLGRPEAASSDGFAWTSWPILGMFGAAAASLVAFLMTERRAPDPIIDLSMFSRDRTIGLTTLTMFVLGATFLFTMVFLPLYLVNVLGVSVASAGLSLTPLTLAMVTTSVGAGQIASRIGHVKLLQVIALIVLAIAFAVLGFTLTPDSTQTSVTLKTVLIGLGMGPTFPLYILVVQNAASAREVGAATAGSIFSRSMGQVIGLALFGSLFAMSLLGDVREGTADVLDRLSPAARSIVAEAMPTLTSDGESTVLAFDADAVRRRIESGATLSAEDRAAAMAAVEQVGSVNGVAITNAVAILYRIGLVLVLISLVLTLLTPEDETLRRGARSAHGPRADGGPGSASHLA